MMGGKWILAAILGLAGCASFRQISPEEAGPYPQNYRAIVMAALRAEFFDPSSIQNASLTQPFPAKWSFQNGWGVCLRANGKNRMGAYAGEQEYGYLIRDGVIVLEGDFIDCQTANYAPWPEVDGMGWAR